MQQLCRDWSRSSKKVVSPQASAAPTHAGKKQVQVRIGQAQETEHVTILQHNPYRQEISYLVSTAPQARNDLHPV